MEVQKESWTTARARLAAHGRYHPDEDRTELRRRLRALRAEEYVRALVDEFPALTPDEMRRLAEMLQPYAVAQPSKARSHQRRGGGAV